MVSLELLRDFFREILFNPAKTYKTVKAVGFCNKQSRWT